MVTAIILSGGKGLRLGENIPKQYIEANNRPIILDCIETFEQHKLVDKYIIVASDEWQEYIEGLINQIREEKNINCKDAENKFVGFAVPGENRQLSIYNGLTKIVDVSKDDDLVIIHDAARPFVSEETISDLIYACKDADGSMPALTVKDTMYIQENGKIKSLIDRGSLIAGQAPEAFVYGKYLSANKALLPDKILDIKGSTEPAFLAGMDIAVVPGDEKNFKITTKEDLDRYIQIKG